jgi:hypothetical protein
MRTITTATCFVLMMMGSVLADARGGHGFGHGGFGHHGGFGMQGKGGRAGGAEAFASDRRHANDDYVEAASKERDRLLNKKLKSICRGC